MTTYKTDLNFDIFQNSSHNSPDWQGKGWYRVMGNAGTRIPEDPFTSVQSGAHGYCGTGCPGYLPSGSHPKMPGELVVNVKVCYNCDGNICNYSHGHFLVPERRDIRIRHCGEYFVYYLTRPFSHPLRYCTE